MHLDEYRRILAADAPVTEWHTELVWVFPESLPFEQSVRVLYSGSPLGDSWLGALERDGRRQALIDANFGSDGDFWPPWCALFEGDAVASFAFSAGIGPSSAEIGLVTVPRFRGRGLGTAVTAAWASHPALEGRTLFYGTDRENVSSQRVVERLGLPFLGTSLSIR